jgi:hypothetical protein
MKGIYQILKYQYIYLYHLICYTIKTTRFFFNFQWFNSFNYLLSCDVSIQLIWIRINIFTNIFNMSYLIVWVIFFIRILCNRLDNYLDKNNTICPEQIGFRKGYRRSDHVFTLKTLIDKFFKKNKYLFALLRRFKESVWYREQTPFSKAYLFWTYSIVFIKIVI